MASNEYFFSMLMSFLCFVTIYIYIPVLISDLEDLHAIPVYRYLL